MKTNFDAYLRYGELTRALHALAEEHPKFCKVESIGKSYEGREIWLAELTNLKTGPAETKPAFFSLPKKSSMVSTAPNRIF